MQYGTKVLFGVRKNSRLTNNQAAKVFITMKSTIILGIVLILSLGLFAQEEAPKFRTTLYGFVRNDMFLDTYKGLNSACDQFYLVPLYTDEDASGNHLNEVMSSNLVSMATRFGIRISGPLLFNAHSSAVIETDFAGNPSTLTALLRLRQAYVKLDWERSSFLMGQTWHPFWSGSIFPSVGSLNTGSPFQPFNRSPQLRFDYKLDKLSLNASAVYEFQYLSRGPEGKSDQYSRNGVIPELVAGAEVKLRRLTLGGAASLKQIKPREVNESLSGEKYVSNDFLHSASFVGYAQFKSGKFTLKAKSVYGQNLTYLCMPSGYGISSYSNASGETTYTNYNNSFSFINAVYGEKWQFGFFGGYGLNLGTTDALHNFNAMLSSTQEVKTETYGLLQSIQDLNRISAHVALNVGKARFVLEYERTAVHYGSGEIRDTDGLYDLSKEATNHRVVCAMTYRF